MNPSGLPLLTGREIECLRLVARLYTDKQIARELHVEPSTVKTLVGRAMRKLDVSSRATAARALAEYEMRPPQWGTTHDGGQPDLERLVRSSSAAPVGSAVAGSLREARTGFNVGLSLASDGSLPQGRVVKTPPLQRVALIAAITMLLVLVVIAAVPLADAVERVALRLEPGVQKR